MTSQPASARTILARLVARAASGADAGHDRLAIGSAHPGAADLLTQARRDRVIPVLGQAVLDGAVAADDQTAESVADAWNAVMRRCLELDEHLLWLHEELTRRGIAMRVLKGPASAHLDHPSPAMRQYGDLDVLVHGDDLSAVFDVLRAQGFTRVFATPSPEFDRRFVKSASFRGPVEIDVHRTIVDAPLGHRIPTAELWGPGEQFRIGGRTLEALPAPLRLLHACLHAHLGPPPTPLSSHADVASLLATLDPTAALETAERWGLGAAVGAGIDAVVAELWWPPGLDSRWRRLPPGSVLDGLLVAAHRSPRSSSTVRTLLSLTTLPTWRDRARFVAELALPGEDYSTGRRSRRRQAVDALSRAFAGPAR